MSSIEDLPNELLLQVCSYLNQLELCQCFLALNERWRNLLCRHMSHLSLSMNIKLEERHRLLNEYFPRMKHFVSSVTIDHPAMTRAFLEQCKSQPLVNLSALEFIDHGLEGSEELLRVCQPERLKIVQTSFYHGRELQCSSLPSSLRRLEIDAHVEPAYEKYFFCLILRPVAILLRLVVVSVNWIFPAARSWSIFVCRFLNCLRTFASLRVCRRCRSSDSPCRSSPSMIPSLVLDSSFLPCLISNWRFLRSP